MNRKLSTAAVAAFAGAVLGFVACGRPLRADDIEIYTAALTGGFDAQVRPNILYLIDTSGSMDNEFYVNPEDWWDASYDPSQTYAGTCNPDLVYRFELSSSQVDPQTGRPWVNSDGYPIRHPDNPETNLPDCGSNHFPRAALACAHAVDAFATAGWYADHFGEFYPEGDPVGGRTMDGKWHNFLTDDLADVTMHNGVMVWRECADDFGNHGDTAGSSAVYPSKTKNEVWTASAANAYESHLDNNHYLVADGNFLNWFYGAPQTRIAAVQVALRAVIRELPPDVNVGLMRFDASVGDGDSTDGGMMLKEFVPLNSDANRNALIDALFSISPTSLSGATPLAEAMYEAMLVFAGEKVYFGDGSETEDGNAFPSVTASRDPADPERYQSPITATCQQNSIVYFTDGAADSDNSVFGGSPKIDLAAGWDGGMEMLPGIDDDDNADFAPIGPYLYSDTNLNAECTGTDSEGCLPTLSAYMKNEDVNPTMAGRQHVITYTIGFDPAGNTDPGAPDPGYLQLAADNGGGKFTLVTSAEELKNAFKILTRKAVSSNTAFTAPALAVNAFNRTRDQNEVLFAVFKSAMTPDWQGNVKKYRFSKNAAGEIFLADADGEPAVVPETGLFAYDARSIWSVLPDGNEVPQGGAASNLPTVRNLRTWFGDMASRNLINDLYRFDGTNTAITAAMLGMDGDEDYSPSDVIDWLAGKDVLDQDGDGVVDEQRFHMGDPLHSRPVIVTYGASMDDPDQKIFVSTNDGFLHLIDMDTGREEFAFIAAETLRNAKRMYESNASMGKAYGLDGAPTVWIDEGAVDSPGINRNGDTDDHVYLFVGMRRGGRSYYAFDFTNPSSPEILWHIRGGDLDADGVFDVTDEPFYHLGQTWSAPQLGELRINNVVTKVLVFGGGFDPNQDDPDGNPGTTEDFFATDRYGNAVYIVDAKTGKRLWWAGGDGDADLVINEMKNSIPADVSLMDMDADGWTDRIYVGDTAARVFRIDVTELNSGTTVDAKGGMIADLGATSVSDDPMTVVNEQTRSNRKIFYTIDVVVVENGSQDYVGLAIPTGARNHPANPIGNDTAVLDAFFMIRDPNILNRPEGDDYDYGITLASLYDATDNDLMATNADGSADTTRRNAAKAALSASKGWYIRLEHEGEKALASSVTFNYQTLFTTFEPEDLDLATCQARTGIGRLYVVDIRDATPTQPAFHVGEDEDPTELTTEDRVHELRRDGIPPAPAIAFPEANDGDAVAPVGSELPRIDPGDNRYKSYWYIKED